MENCLFDGMKKKINDNVAVNDEIICELCDELILKAGEEKDWQSIAFGYVWRADYFFYVAGDLKAFARELDLAKIYINTKIPSNLLEKYYTLRHVLCENSYDIQSAFRYTLKALDVAEKLKLNHRIGANYGNIGAYYMDICCYEEALLYTKKALDSLTDLPDTRLGIIRLLLTNFVQINLKLSQYKTALKALQDLAALPLEEKDLNIYLDYGYLLYYSERMDSKNSLVFLDAMFKDGLMEAPRAFAFEFLSQALEAMIRLNQEEKSKELLEMLKKMVEDHEPDAQLSLSRLSIESALRFDSPHDLDQNYRLYYIQYMNAQARSNELKAEGLHLAVTLNDLHLQNALSQKEIHTLSELANYDDLTKVYNRRYLNICQDEILNRQRTTDMGFALFDIDYFKEYNDYYGHLAGDELLRTIASCLKENTKPQMDIFRYGGDEFICLCWNTQPNTLKEYVNQVRLDMEKRKIPHSPSRCSHQVTLSIGYGNKTVAGKVDMLSLFEEVDQALYDAKKKGRNMVRSIWERDQP